MSDCTQKGLKERKKGTVIYSKQAAQHARMALCEGQRRRKREAGVKGISNIYIPAGHRPNQARRSDTRQHKHSLDAPSACS